MTDNRAYLAFYGGPDPRPKLTGPRMDWEIALAYAVAINNLGGFAKRGEQTFTMTRAQRLHRHAGLIPIHNLRTEERLARRKPDELVQEIREGYVIVPAISDNTWLGSSIDVATAVRNAVTMLSHRQAKIDEIAFIDHGSPGSMTFGTDAFDMRSVQSGPVANALRRLAPFIDERSVLTLGGCAVAGNDDGRRLARAIASLLNVRVQAFEEIQYINLSPGIEGTAYMCGPSRCVAGQATPFAEALYEGIGSKGGRNFGMKTPGWG